MMTSRYGRHTKTRVGVSSEQPVTTFLEAGVPTKYTIPASYQHVILESRISKKPDSPSGGILADDMGLGKTLSMLTAIVMSLDESRAFMYSKDRVNIDSAVPYSRRASSTLVIAPSAGESLVPWLH